MPEIFIPLHINSVIIDETENVISIDVSGTDLTKLSIGNCSLSVNNIEMGSIEPNSEGRYIFDVTAEELGLTSLNGLFFLEFESKSETPTVNCCGKEIRSIRAVAGNFAAYHECLLNKTLKIDFNGCGKKDNTCSECDEEVFYISALLSSLYSAIRFQRFSTACKIIEQLNSFCDTCDICPPYYNENLAEDSDFFSPVYDVIEGNEECTSIEEEPCQNNINIGAGYGVGTINNLIMIV